MKETRAGKVIFPFLVLLVLFFWTNLAFGVNLGSSIKMSPIFYLPIMAAEEKGFWKDEGLVVEWVPFNGSADMFRAVSAGSVGIGMTDAPSMILAAARGVPVMAISDLQSAELFVLWVGANTPVRELQDLKGKKIGVTRLGGVTHAYAQVIARREAIERQVKIVGMGGVPQTVAAMKAGAIQALIEPTHLVLALKREGLIRPMVKMAEMVPRPWAGHWLFADRPTASREPETVKKMVKGALKATSFLRAEGKWATTKMVEVSRFKPEEAEEVYKTYDFPAEGRIPTKAVENLVAFLVDYGLIPKERTPRAEEVSTEKFLSSF